MRARAPCSLVNALTMQVSKYRYIIRIQYRYSHRIPGEIRPGYHIQYYRYLATGMYLADVGIFREKKKKEAVPVVCAHAWFSTARTSTLPRDIAYGSR